MTITADQLGQAFSPFKSIQKRERVSVDLGKVAHALVGHMVDATKAEDPEAAIDLLEKGVDEIDRYLSKAEYDAGADEIFLDTVQGDELASRFEKAGDDKEDDDKPAFLQGKDKKKAEAKKEGDEETAKTDEVEGSATAEGGETAKTEGEETTKTDEAEGSTTAEGGEETATEKSVEGSVETRKFDELDTDPWSNDMSPARPPTLRSERMTKSEFPVGGASRSGNSRKEKYQKARARAMARRAGLDDRCFDEA